MPHSEHSAASLFHIHGQLTTAEPLRYQPYCLTLHALDFSHAGSCRWLRRISEDILYFQNTLCCDCGFNSLLTFLLASSKTGCSDLVLSLLPLHFVPLSACSGANQSSCTHYSERNVQSSAETHLNLHLPALTI